MPNTLQRVFLSVLSANTTTDLCNELGSFSTQLGFATYSAVAVVDRQEGPAQFISVHNTPSGYLDVFLDPSVGLQDPVAQHCKTNVVPIVWDQSTYLNAGRADMWDRQAQFGYKTGISLALHLPRGRHLLIGLDRDQPLPGDQEELTRITAALQLYAVYLQEAAMRILVPSADGVIPSLSARELETLRWTMEGKTAWEVGRILGIAEDTVVRHSQNASRKLGCSSKHHAVVKALRLGLIQ